ncbi:uncharacterized protein [Antedon mediterranea]|uniref:uncharacterized protein n=1 Tax=Antedon mediterranea TaxID=105859 RepID=UPI003AF91FAB
MEPTRYREGETPNVLDLVFTDKENTINGIMQSPPLGKSDHMMLQFSLDLVRDDRIEPNIRSYRHGNYDLLREKIGLVDWDVVFNDKSGIQSWDEFEHILAKNIDECIPMRKVCHGRKPLWMNKKIEKQIAKKNKCWKQYVKAKRKQKVCVSAKWSKFVQVRNQTVDLIRCSKSDFENKIAIEIKSNEKSFWRYLSSQINIKSGIPNLTDSNGRHVSDDKDKAELLNTFFSSVFVDENFSNVPAIDDTSEDFLSQVDFPCDEILNILSTLNITKTAGPDGIHPRILVELKDIICYPLHIIFTKLFQEGAVPNSWKRATVVPIFKKGVKSDPSN